jgi:hypothetical protein
MRLYLYGIIDSCEQLKGPIQYMEKSRIYNIPYCDTGAVISEISQQFVKPSKEAVLRHEAVIEKLMADFTVLPVRFRTIINDRTSLLSIMQSYYIDFKENLKRLRDKLEFGIKIIWPAEKIIQNIINDFKSNKRDNLDSEISQGKKYMEEKFEKYKIEKELHAKADKFIQVADSLLNRFSAEKKIRKLKTENLLLDAVYLIQKSCVADFKETFEKLKKEQPDFKYLLSGPWPAYNFIILSKQNDLSNKSIKDHILTGADRL